MKNRKQITENTILFTLLSTLILFLYSCGGNLGDELSNQDSSKKQGRLNLGLSLSNESKGKFLSYYENEPEALPALSELTINVIIDWLDNEDENGEEDKDELAFQYSDISEDDIITIEKLTSGWIDVRVHITHPEDGRVMYSGSTQVFITANLTVETNIVVSNTSINPEGAAGFNIEVNHRPYFTNIEVSSPKVSVGESLDITAFFTDPDGDLVVDNYYIQCQERTVYAVGGIEVGVVPSSLGFSWIADAESVGLCTLHLRLKDSRDAQTQNTIEISVIE